MNRKIGMYGAIVTLIGVLGFAISMFFGSEFFSYLSSLFISWGFILMICTFTATAKKENRSAGYIAIAFACLYAAFIALVYFAQLTTVRLANLTAQASDLLDYRQLGSLFFNYDLLGYALMAVSTFFIALTIQANNKSAKALKTLLLLHGVFATVAIMPMLGVFTPDMPGGDIIGVAILEFWCAYFIPICIFAYRYFKKNV
jgi:hypothetical protein